ncbi:MAG: superoxide dismutase family protein [Rhodothermales bacterium]|nr:superoxide dismutase family protein [Rhodothermales bacterium]
MKSPLKNVSFLLFGAALLVGGCEGEAPAPDPAPDADPSAVAVNRVAVATLAPASGSTVGGTITLTEQEGGLLVEARVTGLAPGPHGFHVHETGDCSAPDATSAGGHFAPAGDPHGAPSDAPGQRHVGDFGNLEAGPDSTATYSRVDTVATLSGPNSVIGRAVIVHQDADDLTSQPSGEAGPRIACGVIEMQEGM